MHDSTTQANAGARSGKSRATLLACLLAAVCTWGLSSVCEAATNDTRLVVSAHVASSCSVTSKRVSEGLDLSSALQISCGAGHNALVQQGPVRMISVDGVSARFIEATILF
jgi:hypothetical protein